MQKAPKGGFTGAPAPETPPLEPPPYLGCHCVAVGIRDFGICRCVAVGIRDFGMIAGCHCVAVGIRDFGMTPGCRCVASAYEIFFAVYGF